ncbi:D-2-hydroxyacid dehydrogenase [Streptomyces sp. P38-E01]|uniref:D-2-hydroxyacid dehydrogenase n=1 Tax=Streptomyces tardus TaxID=2780544 RepID=A0A949JM83_9ACTN|nr:D-2-hydroxyacid dehydrogenase [Streptomyces tardus]MBU7598764.1 D-2-hydroxyacid dehydrogenase [Streptomyces tardus]
MTQTSLPRVLVLDDEPLPDLSPLSGRAEVLHSDGGSLPSLLPEADVLLVWNFTTDAVKDAWAGKGPRPGWVHTASAGVDRLLPELADSDVVITNARGVFDQPIAEYVAGLVIAMAKDFRGTWEFQRGHQWRHRETMRVGGTRAVVVGSGGIGRAIGRTLKALGVSVDLVGRRQRDGDEEFGTVWGSDALDGLLPEADWVVCAAPLTPATDGMFHRASFERMKQDAHFINIGRGRHVVTEDLVRALTEGRLRGAALDVLGEEPPAADSPVWDAPGLVLSPHMSGDTIGWRGDLATQFLANFDRWAAGEPLLNVVDKQLGYVPAGG